MTSYASYATTGDINMLNSHISRVETEVAGVAAAVAATNGNVSNVGRKVDHVYTKLEQVEKEVQDIRKVLDYMMYDQQMKHNLSVAETRIVKIRQELERKYGNYAKIRSTAVGILQATDVGIVKKDTIGFVSDEMMITTPGYWLAPCICALSAWINDDRETAEKAVLEAVKRNDTLSSLFFALISRRAARFNACYLWTYRYIENQDPENLDVKCVFVLDAFANGLLGSDSEGKVFVCMKDWLRILNEKDNYMEHQIEAWKNGFISAKKYDFDQNYNMLAKHCKNWGRMKECLSVVHLNPVLIKSYTAFMEAPVDRTELKKKLDDVLMHLASDFDKDERPLRDEERYNSLIIEYKGDSRKAEAKAKREQALFDKKCDFTTLIMDAAAGRGEYNSVSTRKFAIALSSEVILNAYGDITAKNSMDYPQSVAFKVRDFEFRASTGKEVSEVNDEMNRFVDKRMNDEIKAMKLQLEHSVKIATVLSIVFLSVAVLCFALTFKATFWLIAGAIVGAFGGYYLYDRERTRKSIEPEIENIKKRYEQVRDGFAQDIRRIMAELFSYRREYQKYADESKAVETMFKGFSPEKYIYKASDSMKKVKV